MERWDHMPVLTAATPRVTKQYPHLSYSWLLPPGMEHRSASALIGSRAALPTQLLLKWESPEKPPRKFKPPLASQFAATASQFLGGLKALLLLIFFFFLIKHFLGKNIKTYQ